MNDYKTEKKVLNHVSSNPINKEVKIKSKFQEYSAKPPKAYETRHFKRLTN
jgi:hypothetical protein